MVFHNAHLILMIRIYWITISQIGVLDFIKTLNGISKKYIFFIWVIFTQKFKMLWSFYTVKNAVRA